jgi:hypothetical protein
MLPLVAQELLLRLELATVEREDKMGMGFMMEHNMGMPMGINFPDGAGYAGQPYTGHGWWPSSYAEWWRVLGTPGIDLGYLSLQTSIFGNNWALHENLSCFELSPANYYPEGVVGFSTATPGTIFTGPCCWHGKVQRWKVIFNLTYPQALDATDQGNPAGVDPRLTDASVLVTNPSGGLQSGLEYIGEGTCPHAAPHGNHTWTSVVINQPPTPPVVPPDYSDLDLGLDDMHVGEGLIFGGYTPPPPPVQVPVPPDYSDLDLGLSDMGVGEGLIFGNPYYYWWNPETNTWSFPEGFTMDMPDGYFGEHVGEGLIFGSYPEAVPTEEIPDIPPVGGVPELHFIGGNVLGVQGIVTVNPNGTVAGIEITDPGATVIRRGHNDLANDDDDHDRHEFDDDPHHHDASFRDHLYHHHQTGHDDTRGVRAPRVKIESPEGTDWFNGFKAKAHATTDPTEISNRLTNFIKTEEEIKALTCSGFDDPLAQTFLVQKNRYASSRGIFVESIDLCFQSKPSWTVTGNPITVEIRPTLNGYPSSRTIMDGYGGAKASVTKRSSEINVADADPTQNLRAWEDPTMHVPSRYSGVIPGFGGYPYVNGHAEADNGWRGDPSLAAPRYTRFKFTTPIYLEPDKQYAIVVRSNDPTYKVWISDARASTPIDTPTGPEVVATNDSDWALNSSTVASQSGKQYGGSLFISQNGMTWTAEQNLDLMFRVNVCRFKSSTATVYSCAGLNLDNDFNYDRMEIDQFSTLMPRGTNIRQQFSTLPAVESGGLAGAAWDQPAIDTRLNGAEDVINKTYNFDSRRVLRAGRTLENRKYGDVFVQTQLMSDNFYTSPIIDFSNMNAKFIRNRINAGELSNNNITIVDGGSNFVGIGTETLNVLGGGGTDAVITVNGVENGAITNAFISTAGSGYYKSATGNTMGSLIGTDAVITLAGEEASSGGNAQARYITRPVVLAEGMDASDIKVFLTANKPEGATIRVYYKVLSAYDSQNLSDKRWTAMTQLYPDENYYNTPENLQISNNKIEYEYISGADRNIIYENGNESYDTFKSFAIKIVMLSENPARVPKISNFRAIAVT